MLRCRCINAGLSSQMSWKMVVPFVRNLKVVAPRNWAFRKSCFQAGCLRVLTEEFQGCLLRRHLFSSGWIGLTICFGASMHRSYGQDQSKVLMQGWRFPLIPAYVT